MSSLKDFYVKHLKDEEKIEKSWKGQFWFSYFLNQSNVYTRDIGNNQTETLINKDSEIKCRWIGVKNDVLVFLGEPSRVKIRFAKEAYEKGEAEIQDLCFSLFSRLEYGVVAGGLTAQRYGGLSENIKEFYRKLDIPFWLASKCEIKRDGISSRGLNFCNEGNIDTFYTLEGSSIRPFKMAVCPIIFISYENPFIEVLEPQREIDYGLNDDGRYEYPYQLMFN